MTSDQGAWGAPRYAAGQNPVADHPYPVDPSRVAVVDTWPGQHRLAGSPAAGSPAAGSPAAGSPAAGPAVAEPAVADPPPGETPPGVPPRRGGSRRARSGGAAGRPGRFARLVRGRPEDPRWARPALLVLLAATAVLYLWDLGASGYGNSFYAAAVQAGTLSWKALFFGSIDSSNYITVDKPPASLWMMALSGRVFGFSSWSMLVPDALCGVASVGLLYASVRRVAGPAVGLAAGALLALTPVAVLMFRFNNPDALLVLLLVASAYCVTRALEVASWRWLGLAGLAIGFGFLTKMLQAFLVLPVFALVYLIAAPTRLRARIGHVLTGGAGVIVGAGWWVLATVLWPASSRPFIGGSGNNSVLGLAFGYNGLGRIFGGDGNGGGGGGGRGGPGGTASEALSALGSAGQQYAGGLGAAGAAGGAVPGMNGATGSGSAASDAVSGALGGIPGAGPGSGFGGGGGPGGGGGGFGGTAGLGRLFNQNFGAQISWLIPAALILLVGGLWVTRRAARTDRARAALLIWGGWLVVTGVVFSYMEGTIHEYYTVAIAPGLAGTIALGARELWRTRNEIVSRLLLALSVGVTSVWSYVLLGRTDWQSWLRIPVLVVGLVGAVALLLWPVLRTSPVRRSAAVLALAAVIFGTLAAPTAYALETASVPHTGSIPLAGPSSAGGPGGAFRLSGGGAPGQGTANGQEGTSNGQEGASNGQGSATSGEEGDLTGRDRGFGGGAGFGGGGMEEQTDGAVTQLLASGSDGYRWVAAVSSAQSAASLELATGGLPVMAIGGFTGSDEVLTLDQFKQYVADGKIHYYLGGGGGGAGFGGGPGGGSGANSQIASWVQETFTSVTVGSQTVYDLTKPAS
ncbi:glycosyltransferase family 39 protein [Pseudofrankia asymbiotica]|uniref:Glycosyl transferase n=1 Tax=Pseudofrankia asymbiotica TaxID=1834516 RepID=A0A1V2I6Q1_9ACTN|nr:glycosyltransferase family 39 protein [Pseudofrankia asymbiotica]ONH25774.1 glycosyl transferase [Pseudofrankia asymbiotica]